MPFTKVIVRGLELEMSIGIYEHERGKPQTVCVDIETSLAAGRDWRSDSIDNTIDYDGIVEGVKKIAGKGHINLIETFAEYVAAFCLAQPLVETVRVCVSKPGAIADAAFAGTEIFRVKSGRNSGLI